jgi:hypothetical protein
MLYVKISFPAIIVYLTLTYVKVICLTEIKLRVNHRKYKVVEILSNT